MSNNIPEFPQPPQESALSPQVFQPQGAYAQQSAAPQSQFTQQQFAAQPQYMAPAPIDSGSFGWAVLGFFFPLVGLILFLVWKDSKPLSGKKAGIGALVGVITEVVLTVLGAVLFISMLEAMSYSLGTI